MSTPNLQLPTPKESRSNHLGEKRATKLFRRAFDPAVPGGSPWELEVGSWELTEKSPL